MKKSLPIGPVWTLWWLQDVVPYILLSWLILIEAARVAPNLPRFVPERLLLKRLLFAQPCPNVNRVIA